MQKQGWQAEFTEQVDDLLRAPEVQALRRFTHHQNVTRYEHTLLVAQLSYRAARRLGLDSRSTARSAMLHDLYSGESGCTGPVSFLRHAWRHPPRAAQNAGRLTPLTGKEWNIIESHMWPMCRALPRSREAWLVNAVDSLVAVTDRMGWSGALLRSMDRPRLPEEPDCGRDD